MTPGDYRIMPPYEPKLARSLMEVAPDFVDAQCLTRFTDKAIEYIHGRTKATDGKPFFLYLPYTSPHLPVIPLEQRELYDLDADPGERTNIIAQHADIASRLTERITTIVPKGRTTPGADQANDTGW